MDKKDFNAWIDGRLDSFAQILPNKCRPWTDMGIKLQDKKNYMLTYLNAGNFFIHCDLITRETTIFNTASKRCATAKCRMEEVFSVRVGVAIAWAKYNNEVIPDYTLSIPRKELVNGDKFISSINKNHILTFIGWLPDTRNGMTSKWAVAIDDNRRPIKTQNTNRKRCCQGRVIVGAALVTIL